jgi:hypothetical protein
MSSYDYGKAFLMGQKFLKNPNRKEVEVNGKVAKVIKK